MSRMKEVFMEIRERQCQDQNDDYFELISEQEFEDYVHRKYGWGLTGRMMISNGETSLNIINLDNEAKFIDPHTQS